MKKITSLLIISIALMGIMGLTGCTKKPSAVQPLYTAPWKYSEAYYTCKELQFEINQHEYDLRGLYKKQNISMTLDTIGVVGTVVFIPSILVLVFTPEYSLEIGKLKGERELLYKNFNKRNCKVK